MRGGVCVVGLPEARDLSLGRSLSLLPSGLGAALGEDLPALLGPELSEPLIRSGYRPRSRHEFANLSFPKLVVFGDLTHFCDWVVFSQLAGVSSGSAHMHGDRCR